MCSSTSNYLYSLSMSVFYVRPSNVLILIKKNQGFYKSAIGLNSRYIRTKSLQKIYNF